MQGKHFWTAVSIIAAWVAVGVAAVSEGEFENVTAGGDVTEIPVVWGVAALAAVTSIAVAFFGFRE